MSIHQIISPVISAELPQPDRTATHGRSEDTYALETALADMKASFSSDFVDGRIGARHNTYQHRARVLRQLSRELDERRDGAS